MRDDSQASAGCFRTITLCDNYSGGLWDGILPGQWDSAPRMAACADDLVPYRLS
jgi:hypothetical protein